MSLGAAGLRMEETGSDSHSGAKETCRPRREGMSVAFSPWDSEAAFMHRTLTATHTHTGWGGDLGH